AQAIAFRRTPSKLVEQTGELGALTAEFRSEVVKDPVQVEFVEIRNDNGFGPGRTGLMIRGPDQFRRPLLTHPRTGIHGVETYSVPVPVFSQPARLLFPQRRELVVIVGEKRSLAMSDQNEDAHEHSSLTLDGLLSLSHSLI